ncbi:MAG: MGMT family protein [Actinomycetes bacterium]
MAEHEQVAAVTVPGRLPAFVEEVLGLVEQVPPGRVVSYGDVAWLLGSGGPRGVGTVLAGYGSAVCWWRVVHADGTLPPGHVAEAARRLGGEGVPVRDADGPRPRVDMAAHRWEPVRWRR